MIEHERFAFEPLFNVRNGRIVGLEVQPRNPHDQVGARAVGTVWNTRQIVDLDAGVALASLAFATDCEASVPLHINVLADTVVASRRRLRSILDGLAQRERAMPPVVLEVNPAASAAPADALEEAMRELRSWGFRIALDSVGRGFGLDLVAALRPDLVKIDAHLVAALPGGGPAAAVVQAVCDVAGAVGTRVVATGVSQRSELVALRERGISWAQGPLLAQPRQRPTTTGMSMPLEFAMISADPAGAPPMTPVAGQVPQPRPRPRPTPTYIRDLAQAAVSLPDTATAEAARRALADHPQAGGVILLDPYRRPTCYLDRNRFMLAISGPYGRALYASRPAATLGQPPRVLDEMTVITEAVRTCLHGDQEHGYDDIVLTDTDGSCAGVVRVTDLIRTTTLAA